MRRFVMGALMALLASTAFAAPATYYDPNQPVNQREVADSFTTPHPVTCISGCASPVVPGNLATSQVSVGTTATQVVASRAGRSIVTVVNTTTTDIYLGAAGVTTSTGILLPGTKGASVTLQYTGALYGIVASGTATVTEAETY